MLGNFLRNCLGTEYGECALPPTPPLPFCWCTFFVVSIRSCILQRSAKDKLLFRCIIYKRIAECVTVHLHFDCSIREYIYSLCLKLGSTLPLHSFRRAYIYSLEKIIIWSPGYGSCALHLESLPETCIPSDESFEPTVTKLCSGQVMLYKNQSKGNKPRTEQARVTVLVHCTSSHC